MCNFFVALLLVLTLSLPGCLSSVLPGAGPEAAGLRADGPTKAETATSIPSTLPERMTKAGNDLWAWYKAFATKVDPAIEPMKKLYVAAQEVVVSVQAGDWLRALGYATMAWGLVDEVRGVLK